MGVTDPNAPGRSDPAPQKKEGGLPGRAGGTSEPRGAGGLTGHGGEE